MLQILAHGSVTYINRQGTITRELYIWFDDDRKTRRTRSNDKRGQVMRRRLKDIHVYKEATVYKKNKSIL